jgi:hypothetical protein
MDDAYEVFLRSPLSELQRPARTEILIPHGKTRVPGTPIHGALIQFV